MSLLLGQKGQRSAKVTEKVKKHILDHISGTNDVRNAKIRFLDSLDQGLHAYLG